MIRPARPRPVNNSVVKPPHWTGTDDDWAILVSVGEPRRTPDQMRYWVGEQVRGYLTQHGPAVTRAAVAETPDLVDRVVDAIAADYIDKPGHVSVILDRPHLLAYVRVVAPDALP